MQLQTASGLIYRMIQYSIQDIAVLGFRRIDGQGDEVKTTS